ncbi:hypothetical protein GCM10027347_41820 [Larkinella harenae]
MPRKANQHSINEGVDQPMELRKKNIFLFRDGEGHDLGDGLTTKVAEYGF